MERIKNLEINYENLSEDKLRDLHLRKLALGEIQGPPTGYPDQDKSWLKYYSEEEVLSSTPHLTIYEFLKKCNENNLDMIALHYFGVRLTYKELFEQIDIVAKSLVASGIKEGDVVGIAAPTTPESIFLLYAINKIGAVVNVIDLRKSSKEIEHCLKIGNTKMLFVNDSEIDRIGEIAHKCNVQDVISLSPTNSLPKYKQFLANPKQFMKDSKERKNKLRNYSFYDEFIDKGEMLDCDVEVHHFDPKKRSFIAYTSGTTGMPKAIELNDGTINNIVRQYMNNGMIYDKGDIYLNVIPIFLVFGITLGNHLPLCMGMTSDIIPAFDIYRTCNYIEKSKPNHTALTPSAYTELVESKRFSKLNLSKNLTFGGGGDGMSANQETKINGRLEGQGCSQKVSNGYGGSEVGSAFSTQKEGVTVPGSVGIPLPGNNVMVLDHYTGKRIRSNQIGDICMIVEYPMLRYIENQELNDETKIKLDDGTYAIRLKDAGYVDENGVIFLKGRYEDALYDENQDIVWPVDIEDVVYSFEGVRQCAVVSVDNEAFIYITKSKSEFDLMNVVSKLHNSFPNINFKILVIEKMPLTSNGKVDRKRLKENYSSENNVKKKV